jgi:hypothetical protein
MTNKDFPFKDFYLQLSALDSYMLTGVKCADCGAEKLSDGCTVICHCGSGSAAGVFKKPEVVKPIKHLF